MEEEVEQRIPFLDVLVKRSEQSLSTEVFRKPTHTNRYLHFRSHHHPRVLSGIVTCLKKRALDICDPDQQPTELSNLREPLNIGKAQSVFLALWFRLRQGGGNGGDCGLSGCVSH